jgi:PAS domain S-box-containing protein
MQNNDGSPVARADIDESCEEARTLASPRDADKGADEPGSASDQSDAYLISIETVPDMVCVIEDGRIVYVNTSGIVTFGAPSAGDIVGRLFEDFLAPEYRMLMVDGFELWFSEPACIPIKMVRLDGRLVDIELTIRPYSNEVTDSVIAIGRDITEQSEAAATLLERERRITDIMENVADGIIVIDEKGQIESFNNAAEVMFGYTPAEVIERNVKILMVDSDSDHHDGYLRSHIKKATSPGEVLLGRNREFVGRRKDGSTFLMELAVREMKSDDKRTFIGSLSDITERKQREEAVRRSQMLLKEIVDNAPLQIALSDSSGQYALVNKSFAEAHGSEPESLRGKTVHDLYSGEVAATLAAESLKVLENGTVHEQERRVPGDEERFEHVIQFPIPGQNGGFAGVGTIVADVTRQKKLEAQLRESGRLNALGELAGGIAHDFNNLLMVIGGYARRASDDPGDPERIETALTEIVAATDKATSLTKQLLAFSRHKVLETKVVQVAPLVAELTTMLSPLLGEIVTLSVKTTDEGIFVETDPAQLSQLLINLAINARDAMPDGGGIEIGVEVAEVSEALRQKFPDISSDSFAKFSVQDKGVGMDAETLARIFEPFFTTKEQGKGTGLGLSMAYGFIQQSKGFVDVISAPGKGTTVEVYFPLADKPPEVLAAIDRELLSGNDETILLAEDDDAIRRLAVMTLEEVGYTVLAASDGFEALEVEDEHEGTIDLLLSDVVMPGLGGFDLSRAITETRPDIKVIFMSGYPSRGDTKAFDMPAGIPLLHKPFEPEALVRNVRTILDGEKLNPQKV